MNDKIQALRKELREAQKYFEASLPTSPLSAESPVGKTVASVRLPRLNRDRLALQVKIEEARVDGDPERRIQELKEQLRNIQAQISAYKNKQTPSERYTR